MLPLASVNRVVGVDPTIIVSGPQGEGAAFVWSGLSYSKTRQCFSESFQLSLTCETPDSQIRYTLNGSTPTPSTGEIYSEPVTIDGTNHVTAAAFREGWLAMPTETHSYLHIPSIVQQSSAPAGYPADWRNGDGIGGLRISDRL